MRKTSAILLAVLLCSAASAKAQESIDAEQLTIERWGKIRNDIVAFGVELYDDDGNRKAFSWIQDDDVVAAFVKAMPAEGNRDTFVLRIPLQPAYVHTRDSKVYKFHIVGVDQGNAGVAALGDGVIPLAGGLDATIAKGYELTSFSSSDNVFQQLSNMIGTVPDDGQPQKIDVSRVSRSRGGLTPVDILVFAPTTPSSPDVAQWAFRVFKSKKGLITVPAVSPAAFVSGLPSVKKNGFCIRTLALATHGFPGTIVFGLVAGPMANNIGSGAGMTDPNKFGADVGPFMCNPGSSIRVLSCQAAASADGKQLLLDLADGAGVPVFGYDDFVFFGVNAKTPTVPMTATAGALWSSTPPRGTAVQIQQKSKARQIDPVP